MGKLRILVSLAGASARTEAASRANLWVAVLHSIVDMGTGVLGLAVLFGRVETVRGWDIASTLALLGVYTIVGAVRDLCIGPSLESLSGAGGEVLTGRFDYILLRPVSAQFLASFRVWKPLAAMDLILGLGVLAAAMIRLGTALTATGILSFVATLAAGIVVLYSMLLALTSLVFRSPGFLFTWAFDAFFQTARYPTGIYPGWLRFVLTWVVPVGITVTVPAEALTRGLPAWAAPACMVLAAALLAGASLLFRRGLRRYAGASG